MPAVASIPSWREVSQHTVQVVFIVMRERCCKVLQGCSHILFWHEHDIVFFHRLHEPFRLAITMRATHRCCTGLQIHLSGEPPGFMHAIRGTVIRQTLHRCARQLIAEALFYRPQHDILHDRAVVAPVLAAQSMASRSQQSSVYVTRSFSPLSQPNSKPS